MQIIAQKAMHRHFLDAGLLGTLKAWLELLPDRTLPNVKARSTCRCRHALLPRPRLACYRALAPDGCSMAACSMTSQPGQGMQHAAVKMAHSQQRDLLSHLPGSVPCLQWRSHRMSCAQIRTSVLQLLTALQIDLTDESRKQQLQQSGLGKVVMFLSKVSDENPANRRLAKVSTDCGCRVPCSACGYMKLEDVHACSYGWLRHVQASDLAGASHDMVFSIACLSS